jgi:hypothetical protein
MGSHAGLGLVGVDIYLMPPLDETGDLIEKWSFPQHWKETRENRDAHHATSGFYAWSSLAAWRQATRRAL